MASSRSSGTWSTSIVIDSALESRKAEKPVSKILGIGQREKTFKGRNTKTMKKSNGKGRVAIRATIDSRSECLRRQRTWQKKTKNSNVTFSAKTAFGSKRKTIENCI